MCLFTAMLLLFQSRFGVFFVNFKKIPCLNLFFLSSTLSLLAFEDPETFLNLTKHLRWSFLEKIVNGFQPLTVFAMRLKLKHTKYQKVFTVIVFEIGW